MILILFTELGYLKNIKSYDMFCYFGLNFVKSLKINLGYKGLTAQLNFKLGSHITDSGSTFLWVPFKISDTPCPPKACDRDCVVPEKFHTHPMEGDWKFLGVRGLKSLNFTSNV